MGKYLHQYWNDAGIQVWSHKCYPNRDIRMTTLDDCIDCHASRPPFPQIDESMIDRFHEKFKNNS